MTEPRQFWIDDILNVDRPNQKTAYIHEQDTEKCHRPIHVIEYSAYQELQEKLKVAEEAHESILAQVMSMYSSESDLIAGMKVISLKVLTKIKGETIWSLCPICEGAGITLLDDGKYNCPECEEEEIVYGKR